MGIWGGLCFFAISVMGGDRKRGGDPLVIHNTALVPWKCLQCERGICSATIDNLFIFFLTTDVCNSEVADSHCPPGLGGGVAGVPLNTAIHIPGSCPLNQLPFMEFDVH